MPDPTRAQDRDRLADAAYVLHGEAGSGTIRRLLYALYLVLIFGGVYGFNLLRAMLVTADQGWVDSLASGWGVLALLATVLVAGTIAVRAGRTRGPVVPQLPYIDTVVTAAIDRALVLRELAAAWLIGAVGTGALIGALVGGAVLGAGRGGVLVIVTAVIGGAMLGLLLAVLALLGQRAASGPGRETSVAGWLRGLRIADLRTHALRTTHIGGAVLAGDLRAARLDIAAPVTRGRGLRLRSHGPWRTIIARDLLGLWRTPGRLAGGLAGIVAASALIVVAATQPQAPAILAILAMALAYVAVGALAEGLRLLADTAGTPPLLGLPFRREAVAHLVVPLLASVIAGSMTAAVVVAAASTTDLVFAVGAVASVSTILIGAVTMGAFRGSPPDLSFIGEIGPMAMAYWYARPLTVAAISGGLLLTVAADVGPAILPVILLVGLACVGYGLHLARKLELGHRI